MISFKQFVLLESDEQAPTKQSLSSKELNKYINNPRKNRIPILIRKLENKEPFVKLGEATPSLVIDVDPGFLQAIKEDGRIDVEEIPLRNGSTISLKALQKTKEFGGKNKDKIEKTQIADLDSFIKQAGNGSPITLKINGNVYENCIGAKKAEAVESEVLEPKADIIVYDSNNNGVLYISHKGGSRPKDMLRWSGVASFRDNKEVTNFVADVKKTLISTGSVTPTGASRMKSIKDEGGVTYKRRIKDEGLKQKACFGKNFGSKNYGVNNVNCIIQGTITCTLDPEDNAYVITANHIWMNGDVPSGDYDPGFVCHYGGPSRRDEGITGAFVSIWPWEGKSGLVI